MNYEIEEIYEHKDEKGKATGELEIRARLEDGRLACVAASAGVDANAAVEEYLAEAFPPEPEPAASEEQS